MLYNVINNNVVKCREKKNTVIYIFKRNNEYARTEIFHNNMYY